MAPQLAQQSPTLTQMTDTDLLITITEQIAAKKGVDPLDLPPLYTAIDVDALTTLVTHRDDASDLEVQFSYAGYQVTVTGDGAVSVHQ